MFYHWESPEQTTNAPAVLAEESQLKEQQLFDFFYFTAASRLSAIDIEANTQQHTNPKDPKLYTANDTPYLLARQ